MDELMERFRREGYSNDLAINGLLVNPFVGCEAQEMEALVRDFLEETGLDRDWMTLFRKGAFLAQDKNAFLKERDDGLTLKKLERKALHQEDPVTGSKYDQPFILYALVACCSLGAAVQGWDESAINQAQVIPDFFLTLKIKHQGNLTHTMDRQEQTEQLRDVLQKPSDILGLVNSAPYLCCAVIGCWLTDPLNRAFGRRGTIFFCCIISCLACVAQAFTNTWWQLFIARFCLGFGIGPKSATVPIYASECTPKEIRGGVVMMWQIWTALGIMLGYLSGVVFQDVKSGDLRWRLIVGSPMVLPIIVCAYIFTLPESPRWLIRKGRLHKRDDCKSRYYEKAFRSLRRLRRSELQAARDMFLIYHTLAAEDVIQGQNNRWFELFRVRRNRNAVVASLICMFFQQFCGVNVFAYYSTLLFLTAGFDPKPAGHLSLGFGVINFLFALPAIPLIDGRFGRRSLLLITFPFMAIFQLLTGFAFQIKSPQGKKVLVTTGMYLFCIAYSPGEGPVPFVYASESMPLYLRDLGMSTTTAINWTFNFLLSVTFPRFWTRFTPMGTFAYYAAWCAIGWFFILLFVPETCNYSLEELDARFSIPARVHARHSIKELRYWVKYWILRDKTARKPELKIEYTHPTRAKVDVELRPIPFEDEYGHPKLVAVTRLVDRS